MLSNRDGYHQRYWNVDLVATKRLANRWMVRGFLTLQQQREYFDEPAWSIQDPTPRYESPAAVASGFIDGGLAVNAAALSEFVINATWIYSVAGLTSCRGASTSPARYTAARGIRRSRPSP